MAQLYEADTPSAPVRSYGWSADEAERQERSSRRGSGRSPEPAERRTAAGAPRAAQEPAPDARPAPGAHHEVPPPRRARHEDRSYSEAYADDHYDDDAEAAERHVRMLRSRRRMLWLLLALTVVGVTLTYLQLASWWIIIPPIALLGGYLMLLREAAQADAESRQRRAAERAQAHALAQGGEHAHEAPAVPAQASPATVETGPRAAVIDLSEHVNDQLYDQYADAKLRAVGD